MTLQPGVTGHEDAGNVRLHVFIGQDFPPFVAGDLTGERFGVGDVADENEGAGGGYLGDLAGAFVRHDDLLEAAVADELFDVLFHQEPDLRVGASLFHGEGVCLEVIELVDDGHGRSVPGQRYGFFDGGVAAADRDHVFAGEEVSVARGAIGDAASFEYFFRGKPEGAGNSACGQDDRGGRERALVLELDGLFRTLEVDAVDLGVGHDVAAEALGLVAHGHCDVAA